MKRAISWILIVALMLGFLAMISLDVFAASNGTEIDFDQLLQNGSVVKIETLEFTLPTLTPGQTIPEAPNISVNNTNVSWQQSWGDEFGGNIPTGTFQENGKYWMTAKVTAADGYVFAEGLSISWTGGSCDSASHFLSEDKKTFTVAFQVESCWEELDRVRISDLPEEIQVGAAPTLQIAVEEGNAKVTQVRWVNEADQAVTTLEKGKVYYLEVTVKADAGYVFTSWADIYAENKWPSETQMAQTNEEMTACFRYSLLEQIDSLKLQVNSPSLGMEINELSVTVLEGNVIAMPVSVHDAKTGMPVEEPTLLDKKNYAIWYSFMPKDGYEFTENFVDVEVEDCDFELQWSHNPDSLVFCRYFSTCTPIEKVELTVSGVGVGQVIDDATVTVPQDANYTLEKYDFYGYSNNGYEPADHTRFDQNMEYTLEYYLVPKEDYVFTYDTVVKLNENEGTIRLEQGGIRGFGWVEYGFRVTEVWLRDLVDYIEPGNAEIPTLRNTDNQVKIVNTQWVGADKQAVTQFEDGKLYYLAVTLEGLGGRAFGEDAPSIDLDYSRSYEFKKLSDSQAVVYICYSLLPNAGDIAVTVPNLAVGQNPANITGTVVGNATVESITVEKQVYEENYDYHYYTNMVQGETFQQGNLYRIAVTLKAAEGYRFNGGEYTVNGKHVNGWSSNEDRLEIYYYFSTCDHISSVALTMDTPTAGKTLPAVKAPSGAKYTVKYTWYDVTDDYEEVTGKAQKGHKYSLQVRLSPNEGYDFTEGTAFTLNGKKADFGVDEEGGSASYYYQYSFLEQIQKIYLPAMTKSISMGQTLPTNFSVSGKNYTMEAAWMRFNGGNPVETTKVEANDIYVLTFSVTPKAGYEFTDDCKIYLDNKLADEIYQGAYQEWASVSRVFFVGVEEITRIDVTVSQLEEGKLPTVTVSDNAKYSIEQIAWGENSDGDFMNDYDIVQQLHKGKYVYLGMQLMPKDGAGFNKVEFYVNGKKVEPAIVENGAVQLVAFLPMGKLGEIEKLTAPKVTAQDGVLTWDAVLNADGYEIYRATSKSGKYTKVTTVTDTFFQDDALAKTYYYKVKAIYTGDTGKNSGYSSVVSVVYKLAAPQIAVSMDEALGKATISWEKVESASKYEIWRATSETGKYTRISSVKSSETTYTDKYAAVGTQYFYKVKVVASKSTYNSEYSNILSATSVCAQAKLTIKLDTATGKPVISWDKVDGAADYWLLRREAGSNLSYTVISRQSKLTYTDTEAQVGVEYEYILDVIGKEEALNGKMSEPVFATCGLAKPVLKGTITDQGKPQLTWEAVEGAVKYEVYRSTKSNKGYTLLGDAYSTGVDDMSAATGKTYYYKVVAVGENGKSAESAYVKLTGKCATPMIYVENAASGKPLVSWGKIDGAKQYTVYRATSENGKYSKAGTTKSLSYEDKKASAGKTYFYKVVANASKKAYDSGYSYAMSCNVICSAPSVTVKVDTATGKPSLSWKKIDQAAGYRIYRQLPGEETFSVIAEQTGTSFLDTTAPIDTVCIYKVQTVGKSEGLDSNTTKALTVTSAIAQPKLSSGVNSDGKPHFNWQLVEGAVKYEVYRSTKSGKGFTLLATVEDGNAYVDETVAGGKTFYYKVVAVGSVSSATSAEVELTGKCAAPWISIELHATSGKPVISWEKVNGAKKYTVYRATSLEGKYTKLGTTTKLTYTDSKAVPGTEYYYKVVANGSKKAYDSIDSNVKVATGYAAQPQVTLKNDSKGKPVVSWKKISEAEKYMVVYVDITNVEKEEDLTEQFILENMQYVEVSKKKTSTTLTQAQTGRVYMVFVVAVPKNEDFSGTSMPGYVASTCAAPKISGKYLQGYNCGTWKAVEGAEFYAIYRSTKKSSGYVLLGYIDNDSSFVDLSAEKGKTYYYKVTACTQYTESGFSNVIKLKTK